MASEFERAWRHQLAAAVEGFDWLKLSALWPKLQEEIDELKAARNTGERQEELGDLLFMVVNIARHLDLDPEQALAQATTKFERRFAYVMNTDQLPKPGDSRRLAAMEARWQLAKQAEKSQ